MLFLHGELDALMPARLAVDAAGSLPQGHIEVFPGVGHNVMVEAPERCVAAIHGTLGARASLAPALRSPEPA